MVHYEENSLAEECPIKFSRCFVVFLSNGALVRRIRCRRTFGNKETHFLPDMLLLLAAAVASAEHVTTTNRPLIIRHTLYQSYAFVVAVAIIQFIISTVRCG